MQRGGKGERCGPGAGIDLILDGRERFARGAEPVPRDFIFDLHQQDAGVFRTADAAEARQQVLFASAEFAIDYNHGLGAVVARVDRFGDQRGVLRQALMAALGGETGGFVAQQHDDLALHVEAGVVVVTKFGGGDTVAGEDHRSFHVT